MRNLKVGLSSVAGGVAIALTVLGSPVPAAASPWQHDGVASAVPATWTPHLFQVGSARPMAYSIAEVGDQMVVGGRFTRVEDSTRSVQHERHNVVAFDATDGTISSFAPAFDKQVWTVLGDGGSVFVGGEFTTVNGQPQRGLAKLSLATGQLDPDFAPVLPGGRVTDLELVDDRLIVSGSFKKKLVALDPDTGADTKYLSVPVTGPLPNTTRPEVFRVDVSPDGRHLVGVGNFTTVGGQPRWRAFMLDLGSTSASLSEWRYEPLERSCHAAHIPKYQMYVRDVDFAPDSSYFVMASTGGHRINGEAPGQVLCDSAARFDVADLSPRTPRWINYTGGDTLHSVAVTGAAVYVQGHSRWLDNPYGRDSAGTGAVERPGGGAIDPTTGMALPWNPQMPQQVGGYQITPTDAGVWFATDGMRFGGKYRRGIRFVPAT